MTLPITFSDTGVKYTNWVRKMVASLKCIKAKSLGSKHMAGSWPGEAGMPATRSAHLGLLQQVASGLEHELHPSTSNVDNSVIIISFRVFPA